MRCLIILSVVLCFAASQAHAGSLRLTGVRVMPVQSNPNLVTDPGFEAAGPSGFPPGWTWSKRNTDAVCVVVAGAHSGDRALKITNGTDESPNVYGLLQAAQPAALTPGQPCTLSVWVRAEHPGRVWIGGGRDWRVRLWIKPTGGKWQRFSKTFVPDDSERQFTVLVGTDSPTDGVRIDDVKLEEGPEATPPVIPAVAGAQVRIVPALPLMEQDGNGSFAVRFYVVAPKPIRGRLEATLPGATGPAKAPLTRAAGTWRIEVTGDARDAGYAMRVMRLRVVRGGRSVAEGTARVRLASDAGVLSRMEALRKLLPTFDSEVARLRQRGMDTSYPMVTLTVLHNFVGYVEDDVHHGLLWRAVMQAVHLDAIAARLRHQLAEAVAGRLRFPAVPRWTGTVRPVVSHSSFLAPAATPGKPGTDERPIFFNGYGHFGQAQKDIEKFPGYGVNVIQMELGPSAVFPKEGVVDMAPVEAARRVLDRAEKAGVAVCLLISPHYMPAWVLDKYPELKKRRDGFLQYCLHAPEGQAILKKFIATAIPPLASSPALQSICLSNEPQNVEEPCTYATREWHAWLAKRHGDVATMNACWGTHFASFDGVPLPDPFGKLPARPELVDYYRWNQDFFAGWHRMLADAVHAAAPGVPVHAKAMIWTMLNQDALRYGVDATLFGQFSQINGNDAGNDYTYGDGDSAESWQTEAMGYDLQRSVLDAPVFNTENHVIPDRERRDVPAAHIRAALWQGAVLGQSATTIWVWERTYDLKSDFAGSIMHHPACAEAVGIANCDLNRAAYEVTALQQAKPQALILHSMSGMMWEGSVYGERMLALYEALTFLGVKVGFVTERQLEEGVMPPDAVLFVPSKLYLSKAAAKTLAQIPSRIVFVGDGEPAAFDEYGHPILRPVLGGRLEFKAGSTGPHDVLQELLPNLLRWDLVPDGRVCDPKGQPVWGVASRSAWLGKRLIVNVCNYGQHSARVKVTTKDGDRVFTDVLTGATVKGPFTLKPLEVRLLAAE